MKNKRHRRTMSVIAAGVAGFSVVLILTLAFNLLAFQGQGQAQEDQPILPTSDAPPTPTPPPAPTIPPSVAGTVLASPEFRNDDSLSLWEFVDVGVRLEEQRSVWKVLDASLFQNRTAAAGNPGFYETMAFIGSPDWRDYVVSARFYDEGNGTAGLVARRDGDSFYRVRLIAEPRSDTPKLILEKVVQGEPTTLAVAEGPGYQFYTWYDLALSVKGDQLQVLLNGQRMLEAKDATLTAGQPGLFTWALGSIRFANVLITAQ